MCDQGRRETLMLDPFPRKSQAHQSAEKSLKPKANPLFSFFFYIDKGPDETKFVFGISFPDHS